MWRGNTANVIRYFPTQALNFAVRCSAYVSPCCAVLCTRLGAAALHALAAGAESACRLGPHVSDIQQAAPWVRLCRTCAGAQRTAGPDRQHVIAACLQAVWEWPVSRQASAHSSALIQRAIAVMCHRVAQQHLLAPVSCRYGRAHWECRDTLLRPAHDRAHRHDTLRSSRTTSSACSASTRTATATGSGLQVRLSCRTAPLGCRR